MTGESLEGRQRRWGKDGAHRGALENNLKGPHRDALENNLKGPHRGALENNLKWQLVEEGTVEGVCVCVC